MKASDAVGTAMLAGISSVTDSVGLGRLAPREGSGGVPASPAVPPKSVPPSQRRPSASGKTPSFRLFDLAPDVAAGLSVFELPAVPLPATAPVDDVPMPAPPDSNVYRHLTRT